MTTLFIFIFLTLGDIQCDIFLMKIDIRTLKFTNSENLKKAAKLSTHIQAILRSGKLLVDAPNLSAIFCKVPGEIGSFLDTGCAVHLWAPSFTEITS